MGILYNKCCLGSIAAPSCLTATVTLAVVAPKLQMLRVLTKASLVAGTVYSVVKPVVVGFTCPSILYVARLVVSYFTMISNMLLNLVKK